MSGALDLWKAVDRRVARAIQRVGKPMRATLERVTAAGKAITASVQARAGEKQDDVELVQHFGLSSVSPTGADVVVVPLGGSTGNLVVIGELDRTWRPTDLAEGETAVYAAAATTWVRVKPDGTVLIQSQAGGRIEMDAAGQVNLNEGTNGVARVGDAVSPDAGFAAWLALVAEAMESTASIAPPASTGCTILAGSTTVKAGG